MGRIVGSGALNLDLFYEVSELAELSFPGVEFRPGGEAAGDRETLYALRDYLEARGRFVAALGGGSAANTVWALSRFGFETAFIGAAGRDEEGERALAELAEEGVDLSRVVISGTTGMALIVLDRRRDRFIFVSPGTAEKVLAEFDPPLKKGEWLHLSSLITGEGLAFHRRLIRRAFGPTSLDPGEIYAARGFKTLRPLLERTSLLFITEAELDTLGLPPERLLATGPELIFVKRGPRGVTVLGRKGAFSLPAESPPRVVDNTGAGDFFNAGVLAGLARGLSPEAAARLGVTVAAVSLRDYGRRGCPSRKEFLNWLGELFAGEKRNGTSRRYG